MRRLLTNFIRDGAVDGIAFCDGIWEFDWLGLEFVLVTGGKKSRGELADLLSLMYR